MERPRTQARERTWSVTKMRAGVQRRRCRGRRRWRVHRGEGVRGGGGGSGGFGGPLEGVVILEDTAVVGFGG